MYRSEQENRDIQVTDMHTKSGSYFHADEFVRSFVQMKSEAGFEPFDILQDPTFTGFKLFFHFGEEEGLLADESHTNSALGYLNRIGETSRYELLKKFINTLSKVNSRTPWMFQSIEGLDLLYSEDTFMKPLSEGELNIICLESIDWKINSLITMYRQIAYDMSRKCEVLPKNLREFSMSVYIYDVRYFRDDVQFNKDYLQTLSTSTLDEVTHNMIDFSFCEFGGASGSSFFGNTSNATSEMAVNNLAIKYRKWNESSLFTMITGDQKLNDLSLSVTAASTNTLDNNSFTKDTQTITTSNADRSQTARAISGVGSDIKNSVVGAADAFRTATSLQTNINRFDSAIAKGINSVYAGLKSQLTGLYLGNVYGFSLSQAVTAATTSNISATQNLVSNYGAGQSVNNNIKPISGDRNTFM